VIFRPAEASELAGLLPLFAPDPTSEVGADLFMTRVSHHEYRPEWTWLAQPSADAEPVAVAFWWASPRQTAPAALDGFYVAQAIAPAERTALAAALLTAAHRAFAADGLVRPPDYHIFLPDDWRQRPAAVAALTWRREAAEQAGLRTSLERLRYSWTPEAGLPEAAGQLAFRPEPDDEVFAELFGRVLTGTLDATSRRQADLLGVRAQARQDVAFYRDQMHGDRGWWRIARTPDGQPAGFAIPSRNTEFPVVGYLGVLPEHRGHGYVDEILAEITRILAVEAGATVIHADTDLTNRPMAAAFERAGYRCSGRRLVLSA
jgi:RimJ/RimL family protein N-acetyltransferase